MGDFDLNQRSILVLGAGELGMAVLRSLASRVRKGPGTTLTVLLRPSTINSSDPGKQADLAMLRALGVNFLAGDLGAPASELAALFRGFETVVGCTGFVGGAGTQLKLARAALAAEVPRYFPWQFGVDYDVIGRGSAQDLFDEQLDVRDLLRGQDRTAWVIISTGMFTSFLFEPSFGVVNRERDTVRALGSWENAVTVTTPADIGTLTAAILLDDPPIASRVVFTAGDTVTYARLADIVQAVTGREVRRVEWSLPQLRAELAADPANALKKYRVVFAAGRGVAWAVDGTYNAQHGIEVMDVERWARENLR